MENCIAMLLSISSLINVGYVCWYACCANAEYLTLVCRSLIKGRDDIMANRVYPDRRRRHRLNAEFEISLPHQVKGRTKNISTVSVSFEVITDNIDAFCPGTIIPFGIRTINMTHDSIVKNFSLCGKGLITRREVIEETTGCGIKLNLGVLFMEELNFWAPSNN